MNCECGAIISGCFSSMTLMLQICLYRPLILPAMHFMINWKVILESLNGWLVTTKTGTAKNTQFPTAAICMLLLDTLRVRVLYCKLEGLVSLKTWTRLPSAMLEKETNQS